MENTLPLAFTALFIKVRAWVTLHFLQSEALVQLFIIGFISAIVATIFYKLNPLIRSKISKWNFKPSFVGLIDSNVRLLAPSAVCFLLWLTRTMMSRYGYPYKVLTIATSIILAWIVIQAASQLVRNPIWRRSIAGLAWSLAVLNILGLLTPLIQLLDSMQFSLGAIKLSIYNIIKSIATLVGLLWMANIVSSLVETRIQTSKNFTPSFQALSSKLVKIGLLTIAVVIALSGAGIDFTVFAVFSGAIGVGIGFGLQKIVSNLISGIILLLDKSIKPGDVIAIPGYYGQVNTMGARYVSVLTRDGTEHLIPNEELIINRVENWSYSNNNLRLKQAVGVHYKTDVERAIQICKEAAIETKRVLTDPPPVCLLRGFGDSSVDLEIRFWIDDPVNGRANVKSDILRNVWKKFKEHNIEIPYPQRDLHLRSSDLKNQSLGLPEE